MYLVSCFFKNYPSVSGNAFGPFVSKYKAIKFVKEKEEKLLDDNSIWIISKFTQTYIKSPSWSNKPSDAFDKFEYEDYDD